MGTAMPGWRGSRGAGRTMVDSRYCYVELRGRAAWADDFAPDWTGVTFPAPPGASFAVNGAAQARDAALTAAEMKWRMGFAVGATFEGEFSNVARSYAGKRVVRHVW
jgi:uncharacterized protein with beta-barrel porin domain